MSPLPAPEPRPERFEGHDGRDCGEHRTTGPRAWCPTCQEWRRARAALEGDRTDG